MHYSFLFNFCVYFSLLAFIYWYIIWLHELQWYCGSRNIIVYGGEGGGGGPYSAGEVLDPLFVVGVHFFDGGPNIQAQVEVFVPEGP